MQKKVKDNKKPSPVDIDQIDQDIFQRLSNCAKGIALDAFHPRLVANANLKKNGNDKYGMPIPNDNSFLTAIEQPQQQVTPSSRAQTTNQAGYRKHSNFFKLSKTVQPTIDLQDPCSAIQYGGAEANTECGASTQRSVDQNSIRNGILRKSGSFH